MIISIPSKKTVREYNYLRSSQKKVNVNETSKKLDDYVYDKTYKFGTTKILGLIGILNLIVGCLYFKTKNKISLSEAAVIVGLPTYVGIWQISDNLKYKKWILNDKYEKQRMYLKNGINAVV